MSNSSIISLEEIKKRVHQTVADQRKVRDARQRLAHPPASNTGGKPPLPTDAPGVCHLDTLTFSLPILNLGADDPYLLMHDGDAIGAAVEDIFLHGLGFTIGEQTGRRINGYHDSAPIRAHGFTKEQSMACNFGYVAWGGNRNKDGQDTLCVHLTGEACESINCQDVQPGEGNIWHTIVQALLDFSCKITRIDVAYDDLDGSQGGVGQAVRWYRQGLFCAGGRPPSVSQVGDWINGKSRTLYIGKRANGKLLRVYEKGHQLGDLDSRWTRYELELRSTDRVIPPASLLCLDELLCGAYPCMAWVADVEPMTIPTIVKAKVSITLDHLTHYASLAYGRLLNVLDGLGRSPEDVIASLRVDGMPRRLKLPPSLCVPLAAAG